MTLPRCPWRNGRRRSGRECTKRRCHRRPWRGTMLFPPFPPNEIDRGLVLQTVKVRSIQDLTLALAHIRRSEKTLIIMPLLHKENWSHRKVADLS